MSASEFRTHCPTCCTLASQCLCSAVEDAEALIRLHAHGTTSNKTNKHSEKKHKSAHRPPSEKPPLADYIGEGG